MIRFLFCILSVYAAYLLGTKRRKSARTEAQEEHAHTQINFNNVMECIDTLAILKNKLLNVENMITDIESCSPAERLTNIQISSVSSGASAELLVNNSSSELLCMLYAEREKLRSSIVRTAAGILSIRRYGNGYGNDNKINGGAAENE